MDIDRIPTTEEELAKISNPETAVKLIPEVLAELKAEGDIVDFFPLGFKSFDEVMGGISEGDLVVVSGRTGHGKTTFAQTMAYNLGTEIGIPHVWFSYEVTLQELWRKFQEMGAEEKNFTGYAPKKLADGNLEWITARVREAILKFNIKVVFIDHLGFLTPHITEKNATDFDRNYSSYLGQLTRQLKVLAQQEKITVVLLAHTRKTKEDLDVEDIAHSVGVTQEADFVFMIERLKEKNKNESAWDADPVTEIYTNYSKARLVKNRRTGYVRSVKLEMKQGRLQEVTAHSVLEKQLKNVGIEIEPE